MRPLYLLIVCLLFAPRGDALAQETGVRGELERTATTTPQEKLDYAAASLTDVRDALRELQRHADAARRDNEIERLQCLNTRLTSLRTLQTVTESASAAMNAALIAGEAERADHELRKIAVARTKTRELLGEGQACVVGADAMQSGETTVIVEGALEETSESLEQVPYDPFDLGMDPPSASPFL